MSGLLRLLPIGTIVDVTEPPLRRTRNDYWDDEQPEEEPRTYRGRVEGYDLHQSKYRLSMQISSSKSEGGVRWSRPDMWAFPTWCTKVDCPHDTDGDGGCGRPACPYCHPELHRPQP